MDANLQAILVSALATWLGAIGIGLITVGLRLNNTVQRLSVIVRVLSRQHIAHEQNIETLKDSRAELQARVSRLEAGR
jgi:cell division protein FtsB